MLGTKLTIILFLISGNTLAEYSGTDHFIYLLYIVRTRHDRDGPILYSTHITPFLGTVPGVSARLHGHNLGEN